MKQLENVNDNPTFGNAIRYGDYRIYLSTVRATPRYVFLHEDYDGAPDGNDKRSGYGETIDECVAEIDIIEYAAVVAKSE